MTEVPAQTPSDLPVAEPSVRVRWGPLLLAALAGLGMLLVGYVMTALSSAPGLVGSPIAQLFHQVGSVHYILGVLMLSSSSLLYSSASRARTWGLACALVGIASIGSFFLVAATGAAGALILAPPGLLGAAAGYWAARRKS